MSGPIIRKYGFPNFEKIFGHREMQHGVDQPDEASGTGPETNSDATPGEKPGVAPSASPAEGATGQPPKKA